jgi:aldose 1-epimerase
VQEGVPAGGVVDGYADEAEFAGQDGVRSGVMAPFSNRIRDGRYTFDGDHHDLLPGVPEGERLIYHGFLRLIDCAVAGVETGADDASVRLVTSAIRPGAFPGYPFAVDLTVDYQVSARGLTVQVTGSNVGAGPAPYAAGWHAYFRLGDDGIDPLELHVPARTAIRADDALFPLDGADAYAPLRDDDRWPHPDPHVLGDAVLDMAFADLEPGPDGTIRTVLRDPATGTTLTVRQPYGLMHVFTGDTLARDRRASIALEPVEVMTDAFNRPDCRDAVVLAPGARREFRFGVQVDAAS